MSEWTWHGRAGHLIVADECRFHLHTHVGGGRWCVSTVGEWHPALLEGDDGAPREIGHDRIYETMVFPLGANGEISDHTERAMHPYNERETAERGHLEVCREWDARTE